MFSIAISINTYLTDDKKQNITIYYNKQYFEIQTASTVKISYLLFLFGETNKTAYIWNLTKSLV